MSRDDRWAKALMARLGIGDTMRPRWSYAPKRTTQSYYQLFHTSPRLDALAMIASDVASTPFKLFDKKQYKFDKDNADPVVDHLIYDVLENPMPGNVEMDEYTLRFLTTVYRLLIGEAFWICERDARGIPREWYPVPPNWVLTTPTQANNYFMIVPMGNTSHKPLAVSPKDVVWFKDADITTPFGRGRARTEAIGDELETDELAAKYAKNYFHNDATPPMVIEAPGATPDMVERFKESWVQKLGGVMNARKPAVIPWKDSKITKLADSVREMDFVESRKYLRDLCNQHWAQPPELSGILENSNRSTIDSAYYLWTKNVITRELHREESTLNRQFVPMYDKDIVLRFDNIVPDDKEFELRAATDGLLNGAVTVNEWRVKNGMKPDDKNGDVYLRNFSMMEVPVEASKPVKDPVVQDAAPVAGVDAPLPADTNIQATALNGAQISSLLQLATAVMDGTLPRDAARAIASAAFPMMSDKEIADIFDALIEGVKAEPVTLEDAEKIASRILGKGARKVFAEEARVAIWKAFDKTAANGETGFVTAVKKVSKNQRAEFKAELRKDGALNERIANALSAVFNKDADIATKDALAPAWMISLKRGAGHADTVMGKALNVKELPLVVTDAFSKWISKNGLLRATGINATTEDKLRKKLAASLSEGIDAGESIDGLVSRLLQETDDVYDEMDTTRATLIARTETVATINFGQYTVYKSEGVKQKEWLATKDDRTRDSHIEADGQIVGIDEDFVIGGDSMSAPGLGSDASENCNCRCTILPVIEEAE